MSDLAKHSNEDRNLTWHDGDVTPADRSSVLRQQGCVVWLTGLSGSGKSTIARLLERRLIDAGHAAYVLDGDNVRHGLNGDLGFSSADREENIRRLGELASLFADAGLITITAFISPFRAGRNFARGKVLADRFVEVHLDVPIEICEQRDPKGLYARARAGEIAEFTGIDSPYEAPVSPELCLRTDQHSPADLAGMILDYLETHGLLRAADEK